MCGRVGLNYARWAGLGLAFLIATPASAQVAVTRTRYELPVSNGYGALIVNLDDGDSSRTRRATHFREHLFAAEEPVLDAEGDEVWNGSDFDAVYTRDLLYDAYFGVRDTTGQRWLTSVPADLDASGYMGWNAEGPGGTGLVQLVQDSGDLETTQFFFAPLELEQAAFVMAIRVRNTAAIAVDAQAFALANMHLGYGRASSPWAVHEDIGENGETLEFLVDANGEAFVERGFAGVLASRAVGTVGHFGTAPGQNVFAIVDGGGTTDLPDNAPSPNAVDGSVGAWQFDLGPLEPGAEGWAAVVIAHHGDPFGGTTTLSSVDAYVDGRDAQALVNDEIALWADFQDGLTIPEGTGILEERLVRHSAAMLRMGQVQESEAYLREFVASDGDTRYSRYSDNLPATVQHDAAGAVLASMPPGNWTYAWIRDGAYAIKAMATLGMQASARDALDFYLRAEAGRFEDWQELADYDIPPYQITLTRYYGFGIEETDFNDFGPNLEFDGFGLFLWALRAYERSSGDETLTDRNWTTISERVADVIVALVDPRTGLLRPDSSIWETHWNGRERHWAYTNITAVRGLCDASEMAERQGDEERADLYRETALALRSAIAARLTDGTGAIAANLEELEAGEGYWDAAVLDAIAMGLFAPDGEIATATLAGLDEHLLTDASEVGWSRNDDRYDHEGVQDLSPWGSDYDSAEWVITDLRGAIAARLAGDPGRSDEILLWILSQSLENYGMVAETYEETNGEYKFNAPMLGFGAGAYTLALAQRAEPDEPACGVYFEDEDGGGSGSDTGTATTDASSGDSTAGDVTSATSGSESATSGTVGATSTNPTAGGDETTYGEPGNQDTSDTDVGAVCPDGSDGCPDNCSCTTTNDSPWRGLWLLGLLALGRPRRRLLGVVASIGLLGGCGDDAASPADGSTSSDVETTLAVTTDPIGTSSSSSTGGSSSNSSSGDTTTSAPTTTMAESSTSGEPEPPEDVEVCPTRFTFSPEGGQTNPRLAGEWQGFDLDSAVALEEDGNEFLATVDLAPGLHAYKLIWDQGGETIWALDPAEGRRKYVDGLENSAVNVPDCNLPSLAIESSEASRVSEGSGSYAASLRYVDGAAELGPDPSGFTAVLRAESDSRALTEDEFVIDEDTGDVTLAIEGLDDGKYTVLVEASTRHGKISEPTRLVFWVEAEPFSWDGAVVYMILTDRFRDGDPNNNPAPTPGADPRADFQGGDLWGIRDAIEEGLLDELGVGAIWLTPWQTNPTGGYLAADDVHQVTGYHGYWPTEARAVDERLGGEEALRAMVAAAHAHGIRVLQDYVVNHVHEDHEYMRSHPEWFRTGCVCGTPGCDWTAQALECQFRDYMPDLDHTVPEANAQFVDDAVWWLDEFGLDGLRVDAVKHVEEAATRNLSVAVREEFEGTGVQYFLMGETAMGWSDCADPCNDENYGTISRYIGPHGLDGQFDFVLYHGVSYRTFAYGDNGMLHADYWFSHGQSKWPEGAVMTPYIGSHDTARFASIADYRGQDGAHDRGIPFNQWDFIATAPTDDEPYRRMRIAMAWLFGLPGAPLLYHGDEYGQWGGVDPNNRLMWSGENDLTPPEAETLTYIRSLGEARRSIPALRSGRYVSLGATEDDLVFGRLVDPGNAAVVALTRSGSAASMTVSVIQLGFDPGVVLHDALGGPDVTVDGDGSITVDIPASGACMLAP